MAGNTFRQGFQAYTQWRIQLVRVINEYRVWLESQELLTPDLNLRIGNSVSCLETDRLSVAVVAEVSRGKTELINAIFFADYGKRLLPSAAGRTTMCPTELLWDSDLNQAYVQLLPIETREQNETVTELKKKKYQHLWVKHLIDIAVPDQVEATLREIIQTKQVSVADAVKLDLYQGELHHGLVSSNNMVEIPQWRHAIVSFPHPLLQQGLVIL
ncbi:hypothetical protein TI04_12560, partial [Achromatium sp. WMS2]